MRFHEYFFIQQNAKKLNQSQVKPQGTSSKLKLYLVKHQQSFSLRLNKSYELITLLVPGAIFAIHEPGPVYFTPK